MEDTGTVKKIFKWNRLTKRSRGKSKYRWEEKVKEDICKMMFKNWITCVQVRGKWKVVVEKAMGVSTVKESSLPEEDEELFFFSTRTKLF